MAQEAVLKVKQAEDEGKDIIRRASEHAKQIVADSRAQAQERRREIVEKANTLRLDMLGKATDKAKADCEELVRQGAMEKQRLLSPETAKRETAINFITERIVS